MKKDIFRKLHLWLSVPFGLVMVITCLTGAILVFEDEVTALCNKDVATVEAKGDPLPFRTLVESVEKSLPDGVSVSGVVVSENPTDAYKINLSKPKGAALYVNQYTGEVTGEAGRLPFFGIIFRLHRWLLDSNPGNGAVFWGKTIVGTSTLCFVLILLTGLVIWWPRNRKMLKNRLRVALRKGGKCFWFDLHVAGGFYAMLLLLVMALTGLTWSFEWYRNGAYALFGAGEVKETAVVKRKTPTRVETPVCPGSCRDCTLPVCVRRVENKNTAVEQSGMERWNVDAVTAATKFDSWQKAYENVVTMVPHFETITVSAGTVSVKVSKYGNLRAADKYMFDKDCGAITSVELYKDSARKGKLSGWFYSLHTGSWGGLLVRVLYFLASLLGATLPITGYYFWIRRLYIKRKKA
jgi:uncharacterized iron-regulated membrane protein